MSFQKGNTFVFGEIPSASKWDQLWRNDDALADGSGLDDGSVTPSKLALAAASAVVATSQTTSSTSAADLATAGPSVTVDIGANGLALILVKADYSVNSGTSEGRLYVVVSGATTVPALQVVGYRPPGPDLIVVVNGAYLMHNLNPGSTTFKLQYGVSANTGMFRNRRISVIPL